MYVALLLTKYVIICVVVTEHTTIGLFGFIFHKCSWVRQMPMIADVMNANVER